MTQSKTSGFFRMLVQRCALNQHRLILPVSITKPQFGGGLFVPAFSLQHYRALVDTGAQRTVVSRSVIAEHALFRTGHMEFGGLHGTQTHSRYLASIGIWAKRTEPGVSHADFETSESTLFAIENPFEIVDMDENLNFDLILGFDVLKSFPFRFDPNDQSFEIILKP